MNVFKFFGADGHYIIAIPYRDKWLTLEEGWGDQCIQYVYIPHFSKRIQFIENGVRFIYKSKRRYLRDCTFKYIPYWVVGCCTL